MSDNKTLPFIMINNIDISNVRNIFKNNGVVSLNLLNLETCKQVLESLKKYKWWSYCFIPNEKNEWKMAIDNLNTTRSPESYAIVCNARQKGQFAYSFQRTFYDHVDKCSCINCSLNITLSSKATVDKLETITGLTDIIPGEIFISKYCPGDFITVHHDENKGRIATTWCFTEDWKANYGGVLCFGDDTNITHTFIPKLGYVTIFLIEGNKMNHFVTEICCGERYMITAWYK